MNIMTKIKRAAAFLTALSLAFIFVSCSMEKNENGGGTSAAADDVMDEVSETAETQPEYFSLLPDETTEAVLNADVTEMMTETEAETETETSEADKTETTTKTKKSDSRYGTYTGYAPLKPMTFTAKDPDNTAGLPTKTISHSYGVPKNGKPNQISIDNQDYFDSTGYKVITLDNKTDDKVLYLTFDCGYENGNTGKILDTLRDKNVPSAFFCTLDQIQKEPELTARMITEGHIVGNHSVHHPDFSTISREKMVSEILGCENYLRENFGYSSKYFRYPTGNYSVNSLELIDSMGLTTVFWSCAYADWNTEEQKGSSYAYEVVTKRLHPGAIILLHSVSSDNAGALGDIIDYAREQGYTFRSLDDYGK
ncbi:MAG: polysaccharide deacetylase family protein [Clostridiales bacterium]|nr:polysaccharide deacetylase family protein [Clostridiales bacterium]